MFDSSTPHDDGVLREDGSHGSDSREGDPRAAAMVPSSAQFPLANPGPLAPLAPLANSGGFGFEPEAADDEGSRLSLAALLRAKWLILGVFVFVSALGIPPVWKFVVPKYSATATVWVRPVMPQLVFKIDDGTSSRNFAGYFNTVMAYFTNPTVLQGVLERPDVRQTAWYDEAPHTLGMMLGGAAPGRISRLLSDIKVTNRRKTELIDIEFSALHACDTRVIVNALVEEFMRLTKEADRAAQAEKFSALLSEKANLEGVITKLEDKVGELSKKLGTNDPDIVRAQLATQLGELQMERQRFQRSYEMLLWAMESKSKAPKEVETVTDEGLARFANDREWVRLNEQLAGARHKLATARSRYGEAHPVLQALRADIAFAEDRLKQRETILADVSLESGAGSGMGASADVASGSRTDLLFLAKATLQRKARQSKRELEILDAQIERLLREQEAKGELAKQVAQLSGELSRKHGVYEEVVSTIQRIEVERDAPGRISVRALAIEPTEPARDQRILYTLAVLGFGLACGVTVAHLRYAMDPKVHEAGELQQGVRVPFLGQLPALPGTQLLASACSPLMAECMRIIRTALLERFRGVDRGVVLITSATSSAGKTTVALELSRSLAHLGKKTLLVEADLRRPRLGERMGVEESAGLAALLAGEATHRQVIQHTTDERLDVVYAGKRLESFNPELLANGVFAECLAKWRKAYDFVMIDSPPILPVADSRILAGHVDGTIMVSRSSHCKRADVVQACADLSAAGSPLLGTVLVGAQTGAGYGYSYEYSSR